MCREYPDPGVYAFLAFVPETEEYASTLKWAKAIGRPGVLRLKKILEVFTPILLCFDNF